MSASECERYRGRLDRLESGVFEDPHGSSCAACAVERRAALVLRDLLQRPAAASVPESFASRVAYLAAAEAAPRRARARRAPPVSAEFAWTIAAAAVAVCVVVALPAFVQSVGSAVRGIELPTPASFLAFAAGWVVFAEVLGLSLVRRVRAGR